MQGLYCIMYHQSFYGKKKNRLAVLITAFWEVGAT